MQERSDEMTQVSYSLTSVWVQIWLWVCINVKTVCHPFRSHNAWWISLISCTWMIPNLHQKTNKLSLELLLACNCYVVPLRHKLKVNYKNIILNILHSIFWKLKIYLFNTKFTF